MVKLIKNKRTKIAIGFMLVTIISTLSIFMFLIRKNITVVVDGNPTKLVTYQKTFGSALKKSNINVGVKDKIDKGLDSKIVNNDVITIKRAVNIKVLVDNKELNINSAEKNVSRLLTSQKISMSVNDKISPSIETKLSKGMNVTITRVNTKTIQQSNPIDFKTVFKKDNSILKSKTTVSQNGVKGEKKITLNVTYENGKEVTRNVIKETLVKEPKSKIIVQGTLPAITYSRGASSKTSTNSVNVKSTQSASKKVNNTSPNVINVKATPKSSGNTLYVKSTAYWAFNGVNNSYTASGQKAVRNPNGYSTIAVDPNIIPLGTKLYIEGYGNAIASDTGSGIKGKYIDVFFNTQGEATNWGVKYLKIHIQN